MLTQPSNNATPPDAAAEEALVAAALAVRSRPAPAEAPVSVVAAPRAVPTEEATAQQRLADQLAGLDRPRGTYVDRVKPALDRMAALVLLVVTLPILLAGMLAVRVTMGPGVFFRQQRVGRDGRIFTVLKLRTMKHDRRANGAKDLAAFAAGKWDGVERRKTHKTDADPRHTNIGQWLRKLSIDELPQLVNVLRGDMSLVGPRPELPVVIDRHYEPWMHRRHAVKPGVTGLWQISMRGEGDMHEHVDIDVDYVDRIGFLEDLRILLATPLAALGKHKGA